MVLKAVDRFDLDVARPARSEHADVELPFDPALLKVRGRVHLALPADGARAVLAMVRACGASAYLVSVAYRETLISLEQARALAATRHSEMVEAGMRLGDLDSGVDDVEWWTFSADDLEALERDLIPGRVWISIDKLDGHVRTPGEFAAWALLSSP